MTEELEKLFAEDPENLTKDDIRSIIVQLRKMRTAPRPKKRTRTRKARVVPTTGIRLGQKTE